MLIVHTSSSTLMQKAIVAGTAFACACAAFGLAILVLIPLFGSIMLSLNAPAILQQTVVMLLLFAFPVSGAFAGLNIGMNLIYLDSFNSSI